MTSRAATLVWIGVLAGAACRSEPGRPSAYRTLASTLAPTLQQLRALLGKPEAGCDELIDHVRGLDFHRGELDRSDPLRLPTERPIAYYTADLLIDWNRDCRRKPAAAACFEACRIKLVAIVAGVERLRVRAMLAGVTIPSLLTGVGHEGEGRGGGRGEGEARR